MAALRNQDIVQLQHLPHVCPNKTGRPKQQSATAPVSKESTRVMAFINTTTHADELSLRDLALRPVRSLQLMAQRRRVYRQTLTELDALSDRDLADLGLHRSMISAVAKDAAYGK